MSNTNRNKKKKPSLFPRLALLLALVAALCLVLYVRVGGALPFGPAPASASPQTASPTESAAPSESAAPLGERASEKPEAPAEPEVEQPEEAPASASAPAVYVWPVLGEITREYSVSALRYDETMRDWRTHRGIDIACDSGAKVLATRGGKVESVVSDGLYGTMVTIDHGDGMRSVYANLDAETAVKAGEWVDTGVLLGTVGASALCEIGQPTHLHFEMRLNGALVDPAAYLSA